MKSEEIKQLSEVEHVLQRSGMYIGSIKPVSEDIFIEHDGLYKKETISYIPAIKVLFNEIISNSIDEFIKTNGEFSNKISIDIDDKSITIKDNGRGLNSEISEDGKTPQAVLAFTNVRAGSNFNDNSNSIGQNGVGGSCVAVFSKQFDVVTSDGIKKTTINIKDNMSSISYSQRSNKQRFTKVSYTLDFERFGLESYGDLYNSIIVKRIHDLSICFDKITFTLNGKKVPVKNFNEYSKKYTNNIVLYSGNDIDIGIFCNDGFEPISFVNGIEQKGGTHIDYICGRIISGIRDKLIKKYKDIKPSDIKNKLGIVMIIRNFKSPRFDSQKKEYLINPFTLENCGGIDFEKLTEKLYRNKSFIDEITETYRVKEELKRRELLKNKEKKVSNVNNAKLIETNHNIIEERTLFIAEGDSALSNFLTCRDEKQAAFPLSGKVTNSNDKNGTELAKSKKVIDLCNVLGLKLSSKKIDDLQYGKIVIFTDADYDGDSIACLLINLFCDRWPDLIKKGLVYKSLSPLIHAVNLDTKEKRYFFDNKSFHEETGNWKIISYNKGLGSLSEEEYKFSLNNLIQIVYDDNAENMLNIAFGKDSAPRKEWMVKHG